MVRCFDGSILNGGPIELYGFMTNIWTILYCEVVHIKYPLYVLMEESSPCSEGVITPNQIPLTTIVTYLQKRYRSRISNHWATIPTCSVVPPIYKKSKKTYCNISF